MNIFILRPRYILHYFQLAIRQKAIDCGVSAHQMARRKCGVGFSMALDKILTQCTAAHAIPQMRSIDVCVLCSPQTPLRDTVLVLRSLWRAGFRTGVVEEPSTDEALEVARAMNVPHVVQVDDQKVVHVRSYAAGTEPGGGVGVAARFVTVTNCNLSICIMVCLCVCVSIAINSAVAADRAIITA